VFASLSPGDVRFASLISDGSVGKTVGLVSLQHVYQALHFAAHRPSIVAAVQCRKERAQKQKQRQAEEEARAQREQQHRRIEPRRPDRENTQTKKTTREANK
jgi:hypothetical protein